MINRRTTAIDEPLREFDSFDTVEVTFNTGTLGIEVLKIKGFIYFNILSKHIFSSECYNYENVYLIISLGMEYKIGGIFSPCKILSSRMVLIEKFSLSFVEINTSDLLFIY